MVEAAPILNLVGTLLELFSVILGALAAPFSKPLRRWMREQGPSRLRDAADAVVKFLVGTGLVLLSVSVRGLPVPLVVAAAAVVLLGGATLLARWLSTVSDEGLVVALGVAGTVFGAGILL